MSEEQPQFAYDAFASYASDPDLAVVRDVERFLESFHQNPLIPERYRKNLELCVDGSDFKVVFRAGRQPPEPVREIIVGYMRQCRRFVLFAGPKSAVHEWVNFEIGWWLDHAEPEPRDVLLVVTHGEESDRLFPQCVLDRGLDRSLWFDLRGYHAEGKAKRPYPEERLRLAAALLETSPAELIAGWKEEAARARRLRNWIRAGIGTVMLGLLVLAGFAIARWLENAGAARASGWALLSEQIAAPQANRSLDRLAYALAAFREGPTARSYRALQQAMAPLPVPAGAFRIEGGKGAQVLRFLEHDQLLFTGGHTGNAQFTSTATWRVTSRVALSGRANAIAVHPRRPLLAVATSRGVDLIEYSMLTSRIVARGISEGRMYAVAFAPGGSELYAGDFDGRVYQYAVPEGPVAQWIPVRSIAVVDDIGAGIGIVGFAPAWQVKRITIIGISGDRCALDLAAWSAACSTERTAKVHGVAVAVRGDIAAAAESRGGVRIFHAATGETVARIAAPPEDEKQVTTGIAMTDDGKWIAVTAHDGAVRIYTASNGRLIKVVIGEHAARSVAFSTSAALLAMGSDDGDVTLWNPGRGSDAWRATGVLAVAADPLRRQVVSMTTSGLQVRDVRNGEVLHETSWDEPGFRPERVGPFALTRDGNAVIARFERYDRVLAWARDSRKGQFAASMPEIFQHANEAGNVAVVSSIVAGPGPSQLVTTESFQSRAASLWDAAGRQQLFRIPMEEEVFRAAAGQNLIAVADHSGFVRLVSLPRRADAAAFRVRGTPSLLAMDGQDRTLLVAWSNAGAHRACLYDLAMAPLVCRALPLGGEPRQALFSPSGRYLALAVAGGIRGGETILLDRTEEWAPRTLDSDSLVSHLAFSHDESLIAAGHDQRGVSIFETKNGSQAAEVTIGAPLKTIAMLPDTTQTLITLSEERLLQAWHWKPADVLREACHRWPTAYRPSTLAGTTPIPPREALCTVSP
jgi:WD40 repeat protein